MAQYHLRMKVLSRNALALASYRAGCKLKDLQSGKTFNYSKKKEVVQLGIFLCDHAPKEYLDRSVLWNAVEKEETKLGKEQRGRNGIGARMREIEIAIPNELTLDEAKSLIRTYTYFIISKGIIVDANIHWKEEIDKKTGEKKINHHAHLGCTTRPIDRNGHFINKSKKVYIMNSLGLKVPVIDKKMKEEYEKRVEEVKEENKKKGLSKEESEKILYDLSLVYQKKDARNRKQWKSYKERTTDWDEKHFLIEARRMWEYHCNWVLKNKGIAPITCKSFKAQIEEEKSKLYKEIARKDVDKLKVHVMKEIIKQKEKLIPTIHEGWKARQMEAEKEGTSDRCNYNRQVRKYNGIILALIEKLLELFKEIIRLFEQGVLFTPVMIPVENINKSNINLYNESTKTGDFKPQKTTEQTLERKEERLEEKFKNILADVEIGGYEENNRNEESIENKVKNIESLTVSTEEQKQQEKTEQSIQKEDQKIITLEEIKVVDYRNINKRLELIKNCYFVQNKMKDEYKELVQDLEKEEVEVKKYYYIDKFLEKGISLKNKLLTASEQENETHQQNNNYMR